MAPRKRRAAAAAPPPAHLPVGMQLTDLTRVTWRLGAPVGSGGFGQIYGATRESPPSSAAFVVKVEPHANGPLFTEMHCYHRVARAQQIADWKRDRRLARLGMPTFMGNGSVEYGGDKYRFMVMERFGADLQKLLDQNGGVFPMPTILHVGMQVMDVLEYLHDKEYIHGDVKGQNLLVGLQKGDENQVYLVDFGLACRYSLDGCLKPYKPDPKKAHDGTIEFTSRDAHVGVQSRRGDLEVLGYNLLMWAAGRLPWMNELANAERVAEQKRRWMADVPALVRACFPRALPPAADCIQRFLAAVAALKYEATPDYTALRGVLMAGLRTLGSSSTELRFTTRRAAVGGGASGRDRSPLQPVQQSAVPARPRRGAKPSARKRPSTDVSDHSTTSSQSEGEHSAPPERSGPANKPSLPRHRVRHVPAKVTTKAAVGGGSSCNYDNVTPSMRAVLDQRSAARQSGISRPRLVRPRGRTTRPVRSPAVVSDDEADSFHTPPNTAGHRRSGRHATIGCQTSPPAAATSSGGQRRLRSGNSFSPELW